MKLGSILNILEEFVLKCEFTANSSVDRRPAREKENDLIKTALKKTRKLKMKGKSNKTVSKIMHRTDRG